MKWNAKYLLLISLSILAFDLRAQELEKDTREQLMSLIEERIEFLSSNQIEAEADYSNLFQTLEYYFHHPLNINKATSDEFRELELLNEIQIQNLLKHREENGDLLAFEELQSVKGFDIGSIQLIKPFVKIGQEDFIPNPPLSILLKEGNSSFFVRSSRILEKKRGYQNQPNQVAKTYLGSPYSLYSRYRFQYYNRLSIGITAEKDAGEEFFRGSQKKGFDFYSAHLYLTQYKKFKQIVLGDFQAQFGQGLTFWSGLAFGGGLGVASIKRIGKGLTPYTSVQEDLFLRGGGACMQVGKFELTGFTSLKLIDANLQIDPILNREFATSIYGNGLHRTENELRKKRALTETVYGTHLRFQQAKAQIGLTAVHRRLGVHLIPSEEIYKKFEGEGRNQFNLGIDYTYYLSNVLLFGEISRSSNGGIARLNGFVWMPAKGYALGFLNRNYGRNFRPIQSNALGSNSKNSNERGSYITGELQISKKINVFANLNVFSFPWLRFQTSAPSNGTEYNLQVNYSPSKALKVYLRYRQKELEKNSRSENLGLASIESEKTDNYRFHISYQVNKNVRIQNRIEWKFYSFEEQRETGFLIYQDLQLSFNKIPIVVSLRYALFETPTYQSRIYAYENDVLYAFTIPAYSGVGSRYYLLVKWKIKKGFDLWIRYDQTSYIDRDFIGSGQEEIQGSKRSQIKTQLRITF